MFNKSDFSKILQVTRRAKRNAAMTQSGNLSKIARSITSVWFDYRWIDSMFPGPRERLLLYRWYHTVYCLRQGRDVN